MKKQDLNSQINNKKSVAKNKAGTGFTKTFKMKNCLMIFF